MYLSPGVLIQLQHKPVDAPSSTVPVAKFVKNEVEKNSLDREGIVKRFADLVDAAKKKKINVEDGIRKRTID